jgi:O-antigen/teichoic acid export membrane protein
MDVPLRRHRFALEGALFLLLFAAAGAIVSAAAHLLIPFVLPPEYATTLPLIDLILVVTWLGTPGGIAETYFRTRQDEKTQYAMRIAGALSNLIFPLLFMLHFQLYGTLYGRMVSNVLFSALGVWWFWRKPTT